VLSPLPLSLCAAGLLSWPVRAASTRLTALCGHSRRRSFPAAWIRLARRFGFVVAPVVLVLIFAGPAAALATAMVTAAGRREWRSRRAADAKILAAQGFAEALSAMVAELRAGAHPVLAAESAAADAAPQAADAMRLIAASARLDGDLGEHSGDPVLGQLARAWSLVRKHGLPMADVLDAVRRDVIAGVRFARQTHARMAGPRASAVVLALLPTVGVALGEAMGARPLHVLVSTTPGQVLLVAGCALIWAGMAWSAKLTEQVMSR
jgi:tight adherence protein B